MDVLDLSDNFANWVAIPDLDMDIGVSDPAFGMFDGVLFLIGGMKGVSFGCAVHTVWAADLKGECPIIWKKGIPLPVLLYRPRMGFIVLAVVQGTNAMDLKGPGRFIVSMARIGASFRSLQRALILAGLSTLGLAMFDDIFASI